MLLHNNCSRQTFAAAIAAAIVLPFGGSMLLFTKIAELPRNDIVLKSFTGWTFFLANSIFIPFDLFGELHKLTHKRLGGQSADQRRGKNFKNFGNSKCTRMVKIMQEGS